MKADLLFFTNSPLLASGFLATFGNMPQFAASVRTGGSAELEAAAAEAGSALLLLDFSPAEQFPLLVSLRSRMVSCNVVLWVDTIPVEAAYQAMKLGVRGILRKTDSVDAIVRGLEDVVAGHMCFDKGLTRRFLESRTVELTPREGELVPLVAQGLKNKEVAAVLGISEATVRIYLSALFRKLGVRDRYELAIYAMKNMAAGQAQGERDARGTRMRSLLVGPVRSDAPPPPVLKMRSGA